MTTSLLLTNGYIHSISEPYANALNADNGVVAWLGSDEAGERLVAATVTGPVHTKDLRGTLVTPAFIDGFSKTDIKPGDTRSMFSSMIPGDNRVYYASLNADPSDADGQFIASAQLDQLPEVMGSIKPPTQLMIQSDSSDHLDYVLEALSQQNNAALMRSRHRILANHTMSPEQISKLVTLHASITIVPAHVGSTPQILAPAASLISAGVHVALGTGEWSGSMWELVTALIENEDTDERISTRAAFNTVSRDAVRVLPNRIAQANMAAGQIAVGAPANLNVWQADQLGVQAPDVRAAHWSTDKRAGTALLPILSSTDEPPRFQFSIRNGQMV
ncbi:amidohydrolase family protein [Yaniella halotolerans]|uniref:amidohydrolase family protein n=1 Tax=Yaniella halotolerans TaxID=225453 RepID=UPI0003B7BBD1|nr:amidohydrolase family protein [Yaniella halotolerans]